MHSWWILSVATLLSTSLAVVLDYDDINAGPSATVQAQTLIGRDYQPARYRARGTPEWKSWTSKTSTSSSTCSSHLKSSTITSKSSTSSPHSTRLPTSTQSTLLTTPPTNPSTTPSRTPSTTTTTPRPPPPSATCEQEGRAYPNNTNARPGAEPGPNYYSVPYPGGDNFKTCKAYCVSQSPNIKTVANGNPNATACVCYDDPFSVVFGPEAGTGAFFSDINCSS